MIREVITHVARGSFWLFFCTIMNVQFSTFKIVLRWEFRIVPNCIPILCIVPWYLNIWVKLVQDLIILHIFAYSESILYTFYIRQAPCDPIYATKPIFLDSEMYFKKIISLKYTWFLLQSWDFFCGVGGWTTKILYGRKNWKLKFSRNMVLKINIQPVSNSPWKCLHKYVFVNKNEALGHFMWLF